MKKILVTGAAGQIGSELTISLRKRYGVENVIASDYSRKYDGELLKSGPFEYTDARKYDEIKAVTDKYGVGTIYHLAALLSATGEANPQLAWDINVNGLLTVLEVARSTGCSVFTPSSIGAFGPSTPK